MSTPCRSIPVVDLAPCVDQAPGSIPPQARRQCAQELCEAFSSVGFVYLINHGIPQTQLNAVLKKSGEFFLLPSEKKCPYRRPDDDGSHGWIALERESLNPERPGDYKEAFNVTPLTAKVWPDVEVADFRETMLAAWQSCADLSLTVLDLMGEGLDLEDPQLFRSAHNYNILPNSSTLRSLYYPQLEETISLKPGQTRCGEHSDYGSITLLFQDDVGGLEVQNTAGDYVSATPLEGAVLVNIGDLMQRWTGDRLRSTKHRVFIPEAETMRRKSRQSVAFFAIPDNDFPVRCIDSDSSYEPITGLDYLQMRFAATYTLK